MPQPKIQPDQSFVHSRSSVIQRLRLLSIKAEKKGALSVAVRAEELLGRDLGMFGQLDEQFKWDGDPRKLSARQMAKLRSSLQEMLREQMGEVIESIEVSNERAISGAEATEDETVPESGAPQGGDDIGAVAEGDTGQGAGRGADEQTGDVGLGWLFNRADAP